VQGAVLHVPTVRGAVVATYNLLPVTLIELRQGTPQDLVTDPLHARDEPPGGAG
jgi:hypothetical protein